ncbi:kinase-like domain-containing protein [Suillus paluster]|nr:kinase-like domain-containing protein [Suillus paluster]KAG1726993.1 kinase-like domain-containing protein [Suillus paluster]
MIDVTDDDSKARITQKLLDYFRARMQLQHENILPLLGFSDDFGQLPAMVSPWMHDGSLITICSEQKWTIEHKFEILQQVAAAISYLHSKDVVHGDLTANNILIDSDGNARVADYGILIMRSELSGTSYVGSINVRWAAPELFEALENKESSTSPTPASDIYSFGCLMLQVMTGQQPYADARNDDQVTDLIGKGKKPTRPLSPRIADCLWEVIDRCWNDVERRPSADQVVGFLHEITLDKLSEK